ncbi:hypothetical protein AB5J62_15100 [Amycolatopsis sp. cg5]|uniref:hypothetical protein n=1 Tax=Amycolatopsis sp. cg5 TaxID=3238802 RepID=UPI0035248706
MTSGNPLSTSAAPYATGGGGTRLEHAYGATLLVSLLTGDPRTELGDDVHPRSVWFQASAVSPVDDFLLEAVDGETVRRASIGVRRAPDLTKSDKDSVPLLRSYLRVVIEHWSEVEAGLWCLVLAVASPNTAARQLRQLTVAARAHPGDFREQVAGGAVNKRAETRLEHFDTLIEEAAEDLETEMPSKELTWRLLSALRVTELRLEDGDENDRTAAVSALRAVVPGGAPAAADALFAKLVELTGRYAPSGAQVTELILRRDLVGAPLLRSRSYSEAWSSLDALEQELRQSTQTDLHDGETTLELDRAEARAELMRSMAAAGESGALVVTGEPDVGKSALTLKAADQLAANGAVVLALGLRDLPPTPTELRKHLGAALADVLGTAAVGAMRLVIVDGTELALAGRGPLLNAVSRAALEADMGVVAVTRTDGARRVREILGEATRACGVSPPQEHVVPALTSAESDQITARFTRLNRLRDERSRWLVVRPGLVRYLLRSGVAPDPSDMRSEADVLADVWHGLVRNNEQTHPGEPTPDQREAAVIAQAHRELQPTSASPRADPAVLPALRSAGVLKSSRLPAAWRTDDEFADDLIRDFAVARLLLVDGWQVLIAAQAPRWAIRAVRLACQVRLRSHPDVALAWGELASFFDDIAERFGQRWSEIPVEAALALGDAHSTVSGIWPSLCSNDADGRKTLVRLALQRYTKAGFGDPVALRPVVALAFDEVIDDKQIGEVTLAWLRGQAQADAAPSQLRQRIRDTILASGPPAHDKFAVEAIATLGPDLNDAAEAFLRQVAEERSGRLWPAVESPGAVITMVAYQPQLMLELAEAYYIDKRDPSGCAYQSDGIRGHQSTPLVPRAAWHYGPFWQLLSHVPRDALALINRILDHAVHTRTRRGMPRAVHRDQTQQYLEITLPGLGKRPYYGDVNTWTWYRGFFVGRDPCVSALLAMERFADNLIDDHSIPASDVVTLFLRDCNNLAVPGLVVGLLLRHLDCASDLLDPWLVHPEIWHMEASRSGQERLRSPVPAGTERQRRSVDDAVPYLTLRAALGGDSARLAKLAILGDELFSRARELFRDNEEALVEAETWRAAFHPKNYYAEATDGGVLVHYIPPEAVAAKLEPGRSDVVTKGSALRLNNIYAKSADRVAPTDTLIEDIEFARKLPTALPAGSALYSTKPAAAVAAAAIVAQARHQADVPNDDLSWAVETLVQAVVEPDLTYRDCESTFDSHGADRSAAAALPLLLLPAFDAMNLDQQQVERGLRSCGTSVFNEVRTQFAIASAPIWTTPCDTTESFTCHHRVLWDANQAGLSDARFSVTEDGTWTLDPLSPPYATDLAATEPENLEVNRLVPPLVAAASARHAACVGAEAMTLLDALLAAHRRGTDHAARENHSEPSDQQRGAVAHVLVTLAVDGHLEPLVEHVKFFAGNAGALQTLLTDLATLFTNDDALRPHLGALWRQAMTAVLDAVDTGTDFRNDDHWVDWAINALIPYPRLDAGDPAPDATLQRARTTWVAPETLTDLVARWIPLAKHEPQAADAIASLAECGPVNWQLTTALDWAEQVIDGRHERFANQCVFLTSWLASLREKGTGGATETARWRRIVDGLAAANDDRAAELQQLEE